MEIRVLNTGVSIEKLFEGAGTKQINQIKEAAEDGFTEDELQKLEDDGVDINKIIENSKITDEEKVEETEETAAAAKAESGIVELIDSFTGMSDAALTELITSSTEKIKELDQKINDIGKEILNNNKKLKHLEQDVMFLQEEVQEDIDKAIQESEEIAAEQKEEGKSTVAQCLDAYTSADGKMTYEEFEQTLASKLDSVAGEADSKLSAVTLKIVQSERKMDTLKGYISQMSKLQSNNQDLMADMSSAKKSKSNCEINCANAQSELQRRAEQRRQAAARQAQQSSSSSKKDPIGFTDGNTRYDFFVDKDGNKDITNEDEFLGAESGFKEAKDLDTNGDGTVDADELENGNVKMVKTNADGSQEIVDAKDVFKDGDGIDLTSYQSHNQDIGNGNILQGTFDVSLNGKSLDGYQTLDDINWLDDNYEFSDEKEGKGRFAGDYYSSVEAEDYKDKIDALNVQQTDLRGNMDNAYTKLGLNAQDVQEAVEVINRNEGEASGKKIEDVFIQRKEMAIAEAEDAEAKAEMALEDSENALKELEDKGDKDSVEHDEAERDVAAAATDVTEAERAVEEARRD